MLDWNRCIYKLGPGGTWCGFAEASLRPGDIMRIEHLRTNESVSEGIARCSAAATIPEHISGGSFADTIPIEAFRLSPETEQKLKAAGINILKPLIPEGNK